MKMPPPFDQPQPPFNHPCLLHRRQVIETAASIAIIRLGVAKFEPLPNELFKYDLR